MRSTIMIILAALGSTVSMSSVFASEWSDARALPNAAAQPAIAKHISAQQRRMLSDKLAIIDRHMQSAVTSREITSEHRMWLLESMYKLSLADLREFDAPTGYESVVRAITKAAKAPRKLGSTSSELVYYPLTPCRYVDTRNVGGPLLDNVARAFDLANTGNVYGGSLACDPKSAVGNNEDLIGALSINVAIVSPTAAPGVVGARKPGTAGSTALVNWYNVGPIVQASNAAVVSTLQDGAQANEIEFIGSPAQLIIDVFGVFAAPNATPLECTNGTEVIATVSTTARDFNVQANVCPAGFQMISNSCQTTAPAQDIALAGGGVFAGGSNCFGYYSGPSTTGEQVLNAPWCCRIPGR